MLLVLDDEPELAPIAMDIIVLIIRQKLSHAMSIGAADIIAPNLVIALPIVDVLRIVHRWAPQVDALSVELSSGKVALNLGHRASSCAKLVPASSGPTSNILASV